MTAINIKIFGPDFEYDGTQIGHEQILGSVLAFAPVIREFPLIPPSEILMRMIAQALFKDAVQPNGPDRPQIAHRVAHAIIAKLHADGISLDAIAELRHILAYSRTENFSLATFISQDPDCDADYERKLVEVRAEFEAGTLFKGAPPGETIQ